MRKNIPAIECFGVFSEVIAFACIQVVRRCGKNAVLQCRRAHSNAILAQAPGGISLAELVTSMSRRQITERREYLPQGLDRPIDDHLKRTPRFEDSLQAESCLVARGNCEFHARPQCCTLKLIHDPAVMPAGRTVDVPKAELDITNGLLASLVFRQVRSHDRSPVEGVKRSSSSASLKPRPRPVTVPAGQTGSPDQIPGLVEALFSKLAARCLGSLAAKERS